MTDGGPAALLDAAVADGRLPCFAAAFGIGDRTLGVHLGGRLADGVAPDRGTHWDLASLTKVLVTTPVALRLAARGDLPLDSPLPSGDGHLTARQLLTHRAGLPAEVPPAVTASGAGGIRRWLRGAAGCSAPQETPLYSDVGFLMLGDLLAAVGARSLAQLAEEHVVAPTGAEGLTWQPRDGRTAPTGPAADQHGRGAPHDPVARALAEPCGHAGLFGTVDAVAALAQAWLAAATGASSAWLDPPLADAATTCQTHGTPRHRGLGWVTRGDPYDCLADGWSGRSASHTGYTGTSVAVDPETGTWAVLLTNAVLAGRKPSPLVALRPEWHAAVARECRERMSTHPHPPAHGGA